jgi:hypothetical protein
MQADKETQCGQEEPDDMLRPQGEAPDLAADVRPPGAALERDGLREEGGPVLGGGDERRCHV